MGLLLIFAAEVLIYLLAAYAFYKFAETGDWRMFYIPFVSFMLSSVFSFYLDIPRPFVAMDFEPLIPHYSDGAFPSDHSSLAFGVAIAQNSPVLWVLAFAVAAARVYAGIHWPTDVLGSLALVISINYLVQWLYEIGSKSSSGRKKSKAD